MSSTVNATRLLPGVFAGACRLSSWLRAGGNVSCSRHGLLRSARPSWPLVALGRSQRHILDTRKLPSFRDLFLAVTARGAQTAEREPARTRNPIRSPTGVAEVEAAVHVQFELESRTTSLTPAPDSSEPGGVCAVHCSAS